MMSRMGWYVYNAARTVLVIALLVAIVMGVRQLTSSMVVVEIVAFVVLVLSLIFVPQESFSYREYLKRQAGQEDLDPQQSSDG